jgi:hypothetical protein
MAALAWIFFTRVLSYRPPAGCLKLTTTHYFKTGRFQSYSTTRLLAGKGVEKKVAPDVAAPVVELTAHSSQLTAQSSELRAQSSEFTGCSEITGSSPHNSISEANRQRDKAIEERDEMSEERNQMSEERDQMSEERDQMSEERNQMSEERNQMSEERDQMSEELAAALQVIKDMKIEQQHGHQHQQQAMDYEGMDVGDCGGLLEPYSYVVDVEARSVHSSNTDKESVSTSGKRSRKIARTPGSSPLTKDEGAVVCLWLMLCVVVYQR